MLVRSDSMKTNINFISDTTFAPAALGLSLVVVGSLLATALIVETVDGWQSFMMTSPRSVFAASTASNDTPQAVTLFTRRLDGMPAGSREEADAIPLAVVIENMSSTRPQSGLSQARVVYETLAEGGITRLLALFPSGADAEKIGPVRSVRHYLVDWAEEYGSPIVHAGGSPLGLSQITRDHVPDVNGISHAWKYFWRDRTVPAPHNLFTNSDQLRRAVQEMNLPTQAQFEAWTFEDGVKSDLGRALTRTVTVDISSAAYAVRFEYDQTSNAYLRFNGGQPHRDRGTDEQLRVENVVIQFVQPPTSLGAKGRIDLETEGQGRALIFRNGGVHEGTWKKSGVAERTRWVSGDGSALALNRGATWIVVVPNDRTVAYH